MIDAAPILEGRGLTKPLGLECGRSVNYAEDSPR